MSNLSGYHDCPCRDCGFIAIGGLIVDDVETDDPALCNDCEEAGCDPTGESDCTYDALDGSDGETDGLAEEEPS